MAFVAEIHRADVFPTKEAAETVRAEVLVRKRNEVGP